MKDPAGSVVAPYDPELHYPNPWLALKAPRNAYTDYHHERAGRLLAWMAPQVEQDTRAIARMRRFERRQPSFQTDGGEVYTHRLPDSPTTRLMFRDLAGVERVLVENFTPSMEYPDVYPNGFWVSPDTRHVIYSDADPVHEGGAVLHMMRTDTGAPVGAPLPAAQYPSGSWIDNRRFVYALRAPGKFRPWEPNWWLYTRTLAADGTFVDEPLPGPERASGSSRYDVVPGPRPGTVTILSYSFVLNSAQSVDVVDLDGGGGFRIQREAEKTLARVRPGPRQPDGTRRLFVLRLDRRSHHAGRIVVVDPPARAGRRPRRRQIVAGRRGDVIREFEVINRGPDRPPALALSIRRHGGEARVDIVELKKAAKWRGGLKVGRRWTPQLDGAQPITSRRRRDRVKGWYGTIASMTATRGDGRGGVDIEYAARESVPHRLYRMDNLDRSTVPRVVAGPSAEAARAAGVPAVDVTLHRPRVGLFRRTSVHVVRPQGIPAGRPVPEMYTAYPYYFLGGHNLNFTPFAATVLAKGIAWINHPVFGSGAGGFHEVTGERRHARRRALGEMRAALRYLDHVPGLAGRRERTGFFQSAGGMTGLDAFRHAPEGFRNLFFNRTLTSTLSQDRPNQVVHMRLDSPLDRLAGYAQSGGIREAVRKPPENVVFTLGSSDPRIPDYLVRMTAAAFDEARARFFGDKGKQPGGTYVIEQQGSGHFPGGNEQAVISTVVGFLAGRHRRPAPDANTNLAPGLPGVSTPANASPPLSRAATAVSPAPTRRTAQSAVGRLASHGLQPLQSLRRAVPQFLSAVTDRHGDRHADRQITARIAEIESTVPQLLRQRSKHL
ncbi:hypothetical protein [Streptodolium elevatio]|uniref:Peptidase S9 prolyl oligopeptidase catalytic domain-containing protein n=1 Tax=Streptodolium elevatio TaxID=3157996 RepID=A0ABV3DVU1_9ACTN